MKPFKNITEFIERYKFKTTIPTKDITIIDIGGTQHTFSGGGGTKFRKEMRNFDSYQFEEIDYNNDTTLQLKVNFMRYFEQKWMVETYFIFKDENNKKFFCPIYFYDSFTSTDILKSCKKVDMREYFGLNWVAVEKIPKEIINIRQDAYKELNKELFYLQEEMKHEIKDQYRMKNLVSQRRIIWEDKWDVDSKGNSPHFIEAVQSPDSW